MFSSTHLKSIIVEYTGVRRMLRCTKGATVLEYAFLAALIGVAATSAMNLLGIEISNSFADLGNEVKQANELAKSN